MSTSRFGRSLYRSATKGYVLLVMSGLVGQTLSPVGLAQREITTPPANKASVDTAALLDQAKKLVQDGDPQSALSILEQADVHGAHASDLHAMKGICFALLSKPIESAAEFERAIL
jgi:hypothetical protein